MGTGSPFLDLPIDVLDKIFATDLELQDHLALSGVCKSLRMLYSATVLCVSMLRPMYRFVHQDAYALVLQALVSPQSLELLGKPSRQAIIETIVSRRLDGLDDEAADLAALKITKKSLQDDLFFMVNCDFIGKTAAKQLYKVG